MTPNPSIEGVHKRLRVLCTPHVKVSCRQPCNPHAHRFAIPQDAGILASLNEQLIRAEGHRNPMSVEQLTDRMSVWLNGEYQAVFFEEALAAVGYALFRKELEHIYLRQLYVVAETRRNGIGREAIRWLWRNAWSESSCLRIEVLVGNVSGREFWRSVGKQKNKSR